MYDDGDDIPPSHLISMRLVLAARKEHLCNSCGEAISPGDRYYRRFWIVDGEPAVEKQHTGCVL